jgi:hypothetical protein
MFSYAVVKEGVTMRASQTVADGMGRGGEVRVAARHNGLFRGYQWALLAFLLAGVAQIFLAGLGVFSLQNQGLATTAGDSAFAPHRTLGFAMGGIALIVLVLAAIARAGAGAIIGSAVLVLLTSLMQSLLAGLADSHAVFGALHALDGLLILSTAGYLYARSRRREP